MRARAEAALALPWPLAVLAVTAGLGTAAAPMAAAEGGAWTWPLAGPHEVSRSFAPPASRYGAGHRGADLAAEPGVIVRGAAAGRVSYAGLIGGRGVVVVTHGDLRTTYEPVAASVTVGSAVAAGTPIGRLEAGHAGCPVPACLHWGLRRGEDYLDPVSLVDRAPVRLLPFGKIAGGSAPGRPANAAAAGVPAGPPVAAEQVEPPAATSSSPEPPAPPPAAAVPAAEAGGWALRAVQTPLGLATVAALLVGMGVRARRRPGPDDPVAGGSAAGREEAAGPDALVLQLDEERLRRRAG